MKNLYVIIAAILLMPTKAYAAASWGAVEGWEVFEASDSSYCGMAMKYEGKGRTTLIYAKKPDNSVDIIVQNSNWTSKKTDQYQMSLVFDDSTYDVHAIGTGENYQSKGFGLTLAPESAKIIASKISHSSGLRIYLGDNLVDDLSLKGTASAIKVIDICLDLISIEQAAAAREKAKLAHIPDDPFANPAIPSAPKLVIKSRPVTAKSGYIDSNDYPADALEKRIGGQVQILLTINEYSQPVKCKIISGSGNKSLDNSTCLIVAKRLRFDAALDENGKATTGTIEKTVIWSPPPLEPPTPPAAPTLQIENK